DATAMRLWWKRAFDVALTVPALIVLSPVFALVALAVRMSLGSPVIFRQQRPGKNERPFTLYKFRTMRDARDAQGTLLPDARRLTRLGAFLRATSLDEQPELVNVLRGDMSLVGPRPLLMEYLPLYSPEQRRRHDVRPGVTGWAQVNGRNALTWREKFALDIEYVEHVSMGLDLRILILTIVSVVRSEGISHSGHVTMQPFRGGHGRDDA
ncbi:MAG TPA: sugar transferase, partial [Gemmatimonadaceae bacterium]|nr:sugar transferase [Gemmatimonadaceae bacterium]